MHNLKLIIQNVFTKNRWTIPVLIILLGAVLRLWQLGNVPPSPDWDEAALGYNAYSILHTGRDEYGKVFPIVLQSFNDYKPALYSYLAIPSVAILGLTVFAVRLPSAVFGTLTILLVFFLTEELFKKRSIALVASLLFAISPWSIQFSRVAFETNIGLSLNILGALLFVKAMKKPWLLVLSGAVFALNLYAYQSEKVFTPLLIVTLIFIFNSSLIKMSKKILVISALIGFFIALPMLVFITTNKDALSRAAGVSIFAQQNDATKKNADTLLQDQIAHDRIGQIFDNRRIFYAKEIVSNYLSHWSLNWLFITGDIERHHAPGIGLLYLWELPFLLVGIYQLLFGNYDKKTKWLIFLWFALAPVPASITTGVPHAVRTLNFLPTFQIFIAIGILASIKQISNLKFQIANLQLKYIIWILCFMFIVFNFLYYLDQYFVQTNYFYSQYWQYGYKQAALYVSQNESAYDSIVVSNGGHMDQSYIFFLFYLKYPPQLFQQAEEKMLASGPTINRSFGKYEFRPILWDKDRQLKNTLFIGNPDDFTGQFALLQKIQNLNGTPTMIIAKP